MPNRPFPRIIALANQKGGVGKTTTAINLGTALAAVEKPTLIVDFDPQGNASTGLGIARSDRKVSSYELLIGQATLEQATLRTDIPGLDIVPATTHISGAEVELIDQPRRAHRLRDAIRSRQGGQGAPQYAYMLIDCPPSLNLLTINAMAAADSVIAPLQCEFFALEGLGQLLATVRRVRRNLNPDLDVQGIILTMHDKRNNFSRQIAEDVRAHFGVLVYEAVVPRNVRLSEAPSFGKPALIYDRHCPGSRAYMRLAAEMLKREGDEVPLPDAPEGSTGPARPAESIEREKTEINHGK